MAGEPPWLFVTGEPYDPPPSLSELRSMAPRMFSVRLPRRSGTAPGRPPSEWRLSPDSMMAIELVEAAARAAGLAVTVIDVNRPETAVDLVERWTGPGTVFPALVRADGARLEGIGEFVPRRLRQFLAER